MTIILFILGILTVGVGVMMRWRSNRAMTWPVGEGEVIESVLAPDPHDAGTEARVRYRCSVGGRTYESAQVSFGGRSASAVANRELVVRYPKGSRVTVYYNPHSPQQVVLERETNGIWLGAVGTGLAFIVIGCALWRGSPP